MIGRLRGTLLLKHPPNLLVDVRGVGYELEAPMSTFFDLPEVGGETLLHTHLAVRDDAHVLYGFGTQSDRDLFRTLIKVSGVGPKLGLAILSGMDADAFARCVQDADVTTLTRLPGIGKKTAERLVMEMRDRLGALETVGGTRVAGGATGRPANPAQDAVSALEALGYRAQDAQRMVKGISSDGLSSEEIIRTALQTAVQKQP
jgi:Holliday junction DNA helicase RuvA